MFNGLLKWGEPDELGIFKLESNDRGEGEIYELTEDDLGDIVEEGLDVFLNVEKWGKEA